MNIFLNYLSFSSLYFLKNAGNLVIMTCLTEGVLPAWMYVIYKKHAAHALKDGPKAAADLPEHIVKLVDTLLLQVKTFLFVYPIYRGHCLPLSTRHGIFRAGSTCVHFFFNTDIRACVWIFYLYVMYNNNLKIIVIYGSFYILLYNSFS